MDMTNVSKAAVSIFENNNTVSENVCLAESFGEYVLSEDAVAIRGKINEFEANGASSLVEMCNIISMVNESGLSQDTQRILVSKVMTAYNEAVNDEAVTEGLFNMGSHQFDGDPVKNKEYIAMLNEMEKFISYMVDLLEADFALGDDILKIIEDAAKNAKGKEDVQKCLSTCLNRLDKGNTMYDSNTYAQHLDKLHKFQRLSRSFNNKYSKITMSEKKAMDAKFDKILSEISKKNIYDWFKFQDIGNDNPKYQRLFAAYEKLKDIDRDATLELTGRVINPTLNYLATTWTRSVNNVRYMRRILGIEREGSLRWKIVHKLFK